MLTVVTSREEALRAVRTASAARVRAEQAAEKAIAAEERAIQDAAAVLGIENRGTAPAIARDAQRTPEHVRKIVDPRSGRGHHRPSPDA